MHLSPQIKSKKQQTFVIKLENFWKRYYVFILFPLQFVAKPCSSSSWDETTPIKFKMASVVKTNTTFGTMCLKSTLNYSAKDVRLVFKI